MQYFAGWDVGGWNCNTNPRSRDALAVLENRDDKPSLIGEIFRGNIREHINQHVAMCDILNECCHTRINHTDSITIAIDAPLGLPAAVADLLAGTPVHDPLPGEYSANPYLYRATERWLFDHGVSPLSAIKDMIGSQTTKAMHLIARLGLKSNDSTRGIWSDGLVTAIETYPTPVMRSPLAKQHYTALGLPPPSHQDKVHAVFCAIIACLFVQRRDALISPQEEPPLNEGWIWVPADAINV